VSSTTLSFGRLSASLGPTFRRPSRSRTSRTNPAEDEYYGGLTEADSHRPERLRTYYERRIEAASTERQGP
jgi:hypothetical protein